MGIESDGFPLAEFNPNGTVSRAEFGTALSRVLWGDKYNQAGEIWYEKHLNALKTAGIMHELIPGLQELRGWIMLMLMRAEANK